MLSLLATAAWEPRTAAGLRSYWRGKWQLAKQMSYDRGGISGTFKGRAAVNMQCATCSGMAMQ